MVQLSPGDISNYFLCFVGKKHAAFK